MKRMNLKLIKAKSVLKKYNQEHLIQFYDELEEEQKENLLDEILNTDFKSLIKLYNDSYKDDSISPDRITPINYARKKDITDEKTEFYMSLGADIIRNGELAVLTLAGGQGTRLGFKGPKGCYEIDVPPRKSLFEFICDKLKKVHEDYGVYLNWYIMTSIYNDNYTRMYFEYKNYFEYPKEKVFFFKQDKLPIVDINGRLVLDKIYAIKDGSNGNGDVFRAFNESDLEKTLQNIKWISISGVDNIILDIIDPLFLGMVKFNKSDVAAKSIAKEDIEDAGWVFANVDGRPSLIDPKNLTQEMKILKNEKGLYEFNQINILSHLFKKDAFIKSFKFEMPYYRAYKKNDYINEEGVKTVPTSPNTFKFEKFIFDSFKHFNNFTLLEVEKQDEFAPIKAFTGKDTPETALEMYLKKNK